MQENFLIKLSESGLDLVVVNPESSATANNFVFESIMGSNGMTLENKRPKLKKLKPMNLQKQTFTRRAMQFSLKNPNYPSSLIRMRFNINGTRGSYYLPLTYKIESVYWDSVAGCAIIDPKRNPKLKGNPQLQTTLNNVNREIEKTANELMSVVESLKTRDIIPTYTLVKAELIKRLRGSEKTVEVKNEFKDFVEVSPPTRLRAACRPCRLCKSRDTSPNHRILVYALYPSFQRGERRHTTITRIF